MILSWSGGKDSALTLWELQKRDTPARALLTTVTASYDRISMHGVRRSILRAQADRAGVPVLEAIIEPGATNDAYEAAFANGLQRARTVAGGDRVVAFGDLFLSDVRAYREQLAARLGWSPVFPLWLRDTRALATEFIDAGFRAILCCVDTQQLSGDFVGREFDHQLLRDLPSHVDPCGERGEFHTCVYDGPVFSSAIPLERGERVRRDERFEFCDLIPR